jgi:hypothetical protein
MSTIKVTNIEHESTGNGGIQLDSSGHVTVDGQQMPTTGPLSNRNILINGDCRIAQRTTASQTQTAGGSVFGVDRFYAYATQASKVTVQQNQASVTPPVGFQKYLGITSSSAYSSSSTDVFSFGQVIEAQNAAQLAWGTSDAKSITLSFWVRSSLTGTHSGAIMNGSFNRSYPYSYTISSANTWEYKTITVPGDTSGTWTMTGNGKFGYIIWDYGTGSDKRGTAGAWTGSQKEGVTGAVQLVGTNGATWYITGIQLEVGDKATPFEHRSYGDELARCQRYYQKSYNYVDAAGSATSTGTAWQTIAQGGGRITHTAYLSTPMRSSPTLTLYDWAGASGKIRTQAGNGQTPSASYVSEHTVIVDANNVSITECIFQYTVAAEL